MLICVQGGSAALECNSDRDQLMLHGGVLVALS